MGLLNKQIARIAQTGEVVRDKTKVYSSMYKRYFEENDTMVCIEKDQK